MESENITICVNNAETHVEENLDHGQGLGDQVCVMCQ